MTIETAGQVEVGQQAPGFTLKDQHGQAVSLSEFAGSKSVALIFYPFAFSGICRGELCEIRDNLASFEADDVQVLAVSVDTVHTLRTFGDVEGYVFPLLSDFWPHGGVAKRYGVFNEVNGGALRATFLIDPAGVVRWKVVNPPTQARSLLDYREAIAAL
jgi:peroxiredoxin (alkyl hydroperoxide reductase subunit C)